MKKRLLIVLLMLTFLLIFHGQAWAGTLSPISGSMAGYGAYWNFQPFASAVSSNGTLTAVGYYYDGSVIPPPSYGNKLATFNGSSWNMGVNYPGTLKNITDMKIAPNDDIYITEGIYLRKCSASVWTVYTVTGSQTITGMTIASDGTVYVSASTSLYKLSGTSLVLVTDLKGSLSSINMARFANSPDGNIYIGASLSTGGYNVFKWDGTTLTSMTSGATGYVRDITLSSDLRPIINIAATGVYKYNGTSWVYMGAYNASIKEITLAPDGAVWGADLNNLYRLNSGGTWDLICNYEASVSNEVIIGIHVVSDGIIVGSGDSTGSYPGGDLYKWTMPIPSFSLASAQTSLTVSCNYNTYGFAGKIQTSTNNSTWSDYCYTTGETSVAISGLNPATLYYVRLAYRGPDSFIWYYTASQSRYTIPATPATPTGTTYGVSWSNNANIPGKSGVTVNWSPVTGASGYYIYVYDGNAYQKVQQIVGGNVTSWDSNIAKIYPSDTTLDGYTNNSQSGFLFVTPGTGNDLPDSPWKLYLKTVGTTNDSKTNYWIKVSAYNLGGESPQSAAYTPTLTCRTDTVDPTGTISLNNGAYNTSTPTVTATVTANDTISGVSAISFSFDNSVWQSWQSFASTVQLTVPIGPGTKTVYYRVQDIAGNISDVYTASIYEIIDTTPPVISISVNDGLSQTNTRLNDISVLAQDDSCSPDQLSMRASLDGKNWYVYNSGSSSWASSTGWGAYTAVTHNFDLGSSGGQKYIYVQVEDLSGNVSNTTKTIFYVTAAVQPSTTTSVQVSNASWGTSGNGMYVTVDSNVMMVSQGNSVSLNLTGISNSSKLLTSFDGVSWSSPDVIPSGTASITKTVSFSQQGKNTLNIKLVNDYGVESSVLTRYYLVDYTPPSISVQTASGATLTSGSSINLFVKASDNVSTKLAYRVNSSSWTVLPANGIISSGTLSSGRNQLNVQVVDEAGNIAQGVVNVWKS